MMATDETSASSRLFDEKGRRGPTPLANQLQAVGRIVIRSALRKYPKELDLSFVEAAVIGGVGTFGPIAARELAELLTMHEGQLSRMLKQLDGRAWIERLPDPADSRRKMLMLSKTGKAVYRKVIRIQEEREAQFLAGISDEDWQIFRDTLSRIRANAEAVLANED